MVKITTSRYRNVYYNFEKGEKLSDMDFLTNGFPVGICPKCGEKLVVRNGSFGKFVACGGFKKGCKNTYNIKNFKTAFAFEVSKIPSKNKACEINYYLHKR